MGGISFETEAAGRNAREAFETAVADAIFNHGHESYSGTIKEKDGYVEIPLPKGKNPYEYANELMNADDRRISDKWGPAGCILMDESDLWEDVAYATERHQKKRSGSRKWKTQYTVTKSILNQQELRFHDVAIRSFDKQTDAESFAKKYTVDHNAPTKIIIEKVLEKETNEVVMFKPKTKKKKIPGGDKTYLFFGIASY